MGKLFLFVLFGCSASICAQDRSYSLNSSFHDAQTVEFVSVDGERGRTIKGRLSGKNGVQYHIPDVCEPEGGEAELVDAYTVKGKESYFLFTCAWIVQHSGIGIDGTQYETFVYTRENPSLIVKQTEFSKKLSGYEGRLEGGGRSHFWYSKRKIASVKILELEAGKSMDSISLASSVVRDRLSDADVDAIKAYLGAERIQQLLVDFPVGRSTVVAYNDIGYALAFAGEEVIAYEILKRVEEVAPGRVALKLNIADVLWSSDKEHSRVYYKQYVSLMGEVGKERLIPLRVIERINSN
ncbi:hypothetical protein J1G35_30245 [Pseudomonas sp. SH10-3B]|uniref:hypothetical protein n=1 Tax=Pseudomonas sp. SH10-3B TaxID=2816049 RepID=UPI001CA66A3E|nr:hypothetical protein [Pseudomonas sp. SH10-3B]MBY8950160.1 hypothetical protein [Pseudomonas sp. SH10-3B]